MGKMVGMNCVDQKHLAELIKRSSHDICYRIVYSLSGESEDEITSAMCNYRTVRRFM